MMLSRRWSLKGISSVPRWDFGCASRTDRSAAPADIRVQTPSQAPAESSKMIRYLAYGLCAVALSVAPAHAGKRDDTLRAASNIVPESFDSYFNATREGV